MRLIGIAIVIFVCMLSCVSSVTAATYEEYTEKISELEGQLTTLLTFDITEELYSELQRIWIALKDLRTEAQKSRVSGDLTDKELNDIWTYVDTVKELFPNGYWNHDPRSGPEAETVTVTDACEICPPSNVPVSFAMVAPGPVCC